MQVSVGTSSRRYDHDHAVQAARPHLTVNDLLADEQHRHLAPDALSAGLTSIDREGTRSGGVDRLSTAARRAVYQQVGVAAERVLDFDLMDALIEGWLKYRTLVEEGRRTLGSTASEVVQLVSHRVTSTYTPVIVVYIDEVPVGKVDLRLELVFDIVGCAAVVASGDLVAVEGGYVKVTGSLSVKGKVVVTKSKQFDSHLVVNLRRPLPLTRVAI